jgi:ABC-type amino acid transport substrate-binding protein
MTARLAKGGESMRVIGRTAPFALAFVLIGILVGFTLAATVDEYGTNGMILGVSFTGGDGSYKKASREGITLGVVPDPPWTYQDATTHQYGGLDVWIMQDALRRLGISKISYQIMPFDGLVPSLQSKSIDVIVDNIHENPKRLEVINFTSPAYWYGGVFSVQKGNPKHITSWESLKGTTVGALRGTFYQPILESRKGDVKEIKLYSTSDVEFADLAAGRLDAVLDDDIKTIQFIQAHKGINIELTDFSLPQTWALGYARYALRKDDVDLNHAISRALEEMRADGTILKFLIKVGLPARNMFNYVIPK